MMSCSGKEQTQYLILVPYAATTPCPTASTASTSGQQQQQPGSKLTTTSKITWPLAEFDDHPGDVAVTTKAPTTRTTTTTSPKLARGNLILSGVCEYHKAVNGMTFEYLGKTADNSPYYKARNIEEYIYYDRDCDGNGTSNVSRWVLDSNRPSLSSLQDLDGDGACNYHRVLTVRRALAVRLRVHFGQCSARALVGRR